MHDQQERHFFGFSALIRSHVILSSLVLLRILRIGNVIRKNDK